MCEEKIFSNESFIVSNSKYEPKIQSFKEKFKIKRNFIKANFLFRHPYLQHNSDHCRFVANHVC